MNVKTNPYEVSRKNRIALLLPSLVGGGAERVFLTLAEEFLNHGYQVDLIAAGAFGDLLGQVDPRCQFVDLKQKSVFRALPGLVRYLRREKPPVLISALTHLNIIAAWANRLAGGKTKLILTEHLAVIGKIRWVDYLIGPLVRFTYPSASAVVAVSEGVAAALRRIVGENLPVSVIHNPINLSRIDALASQNPTHPWFGSKQIPVLLAVGRLHRNKDYETLIQAFSIAAANRPLRLVILGQGEEREGLEDMVRKLNLEECISMPGFTDNPFAFMRRADVFVMSSIYEGLPMVLIEALACGAAIVSTDCPSGPSEILKNGKYGRLVPTRNPEAMAAAIVEMLEHPISGSLCRERAEDFKAVRISERYLDLIERVCSEEQSARNA